MNQNNLSKWLKAVIIGLFIVCCLVFFLIIPSYGASIASLYPEFEYCFWPWLCFLLLCSLPVFAALFFAWKIASNIGHDRSFSQENARHLKTIAVLAAADSAFFFLGNWVLVFLNMNHPGIALIFASIVVFVGFSLSVAAAALSHLVYKSAALQAESDLTI